MDKISKIRISFERLLKVWLSKLDSAEEDLVAEDLIWFAEIFDDFFKGNNLNEFINRDGRYNPTEVFNIDFSDFLDTSIQYSNNKAERWSHLKVEKPKQFEYDKQLNDFNARNYKNYNIVDIYFRILKKLYYAGLEKDLIRIKSIIQSRIISTVHKVCLFEFPGFNSKALLIDFYYEVLNYLFTEQEIKSDRPDEEFISTSLFKSTFYVYYLPLFKPDKVPIAKQYLLDIWVYLNGLKKDKLLLEFLNSLSDMTISSSSFREIDLYDIRSLLTTEDRDSEYYKFLDQVKNDANKIISFKDFENFQQNQKMIQVETPKYIPENITEYFLKTEEDGAIQLYKFRSMQVLVLEYLSIVLYFKGKENFIKSFNRLRRNEQWSNHRTFFPKSMNDVLVWLIIYSELKREMNFRIESPIGYKFLDNIIVFFFKDIVYEETSMKHTLTLRGLVLDSSFLNSMTGISNDLLKKIDGNVLLSDEEKEKSITFWESLFNLFGSRFKKSESRTPIEPKIFVNLISDITNQYKDKSLIYFLSKNLSPFERKEDTQLEFKTFVNATDLQLRKYLIPDWYSPAYGLSESIGRFLFEEEIMQLDYNFFNEQIPLQRRELKRESIQELIDNYGADSLFLFRNAFPDFWIKKINLRSDKLMTNNPDLSQVTFSYNTYDRGSELIIVPKHSMSIKYIFDGRFKNLEFLDNTLIYELLDLGEGNKDNRKAVKSIKWFKDRFNLDDEELSKHFWVRIVAKTKIVIKDKDSILRFKLDPYGE